MLYGGRINEFDEKLEKVEKGNRKIEWVYKFFSSYNESNCIEKGYLKSGVDEGMKINLFNKCRGN